MLLVTKKIQNCFEKIPTHLLIFHNWRVSEFIVNYELYYKILLWWYFDFSYIM